MSHALETKVFTAHVPHALADRIDQLAARQDRPRGWIIKQALTAWVELEEERDQMTREALALVDAGHILSHEAVENWISSLKTAV